MALKFTAKVDQAALKNVQEKFEDLSKPIAKTTANKLGKAIVDEMKNMIAKGSSPIRGHGKFSAYRGQYRKQIQKKGYVSVGGKKVSKKLRPVNLKLTGDFLKSLKSKAIIAKTGYMASIGFRGKKSQNKERGHREMANNQGFRPIIPQAPKERWAQRIQAIIIDFFNSDVRKIAKRKG